MAEENNQGRKQMRRNMVSAVWEHFARFRDDDGKDKARCKRCRLVLAAGTGNGTSSLWRHVRVCKEKERDDGGCREELQPPPTMSPAPSLSVEPFDLRSLLSSPFFFGDDEINHFPVYCNHVPEEGEGEAAADRMPGLIEQHASEDLARMIVLHGYDPSILEDDHFRSFVRRLNPGFELPSRFAIEEMCDGIFDEARTDLFSRLRHTSGRVSLAVGKAETEEVDVLYTACHFIDDEWNLHKMVMNAYDHLPWPQYHGPLSGVPEVALNFYDLCTLAIDHAMDGISGRDACDRVFMVAWDKREPYNRVELKSYIEQKFPGYHPRRREVICDTYMDLVFHFIARRLTTHPELIADMVVEDSIESGVQGLHLTRQHRQRLLSHLGLDSLRVYQERWYSCYCSLRVLLEEGSLCTGIAGIRSELAVMLCNVWGKLYRAIRAVSASSGPTSNLCLAELLSVREVLQAEMVRTGGNKNDADALRKARDTLDRWIQDSYLVWCTPLVVDPRYKLAYLKFSFRRVFGSKAEHYIAEVTRKIKKLYTDYVEYGGRTSSSQDSGGGVMAMPVGGADPLEQAWDERCRSQDGMQAEVDSGNSEAETELDRYLKDRLAPRTQQGFDILNWWKVHSSRYPTMALMARDALAMPTCSKLSPEQIAQVRSIVRGYSKKEYIHINSWAELQ